MTEQHGMATKRQLDIDDVLKLDTFHETHGSCFDFSPDGKYLAFCVQRSMHGAARHTDLFLSGVARSELRIVDLQNMEIQRVAAEGECCLPCWSPDGRTLAFGVATSDAFRLALLDNRTHRHLMPITANLELRGKRPFEWISNTCIACAVVPAGGLPKLVDLDRRACRRSAKLWQQRDVPGQTTVSVLDTGSAESSTAEADSEATDYVAVDARSGHALTALDAHQQQGLSSFRDRFSSSASDDRNRLCAEDWPEYPDGRLVAAHPGAGRGLYLVEDAAGSALVLLDGGTDRPVELFRTNRHLANVRAALVRDVDYTDAEEETKTVRLLLPPDYREGQACPAVLWAYPGAKVGRHVRHLLKPHEPGPFCLQLLAAHGYVVIEPDLPIPSDLGDRNLAQWVAFQAGEAVRAAIASGAVDPERLHVMGHSLGGWAAMALLAETKWFRSGIAMGGISNVASFHGAFDPRFRYDDDERDASALAALCERVFGLPGPPCEMPDRYVEISPVFAAQRISAPLLIVQGDQDYVPITQGEEMFSALRRLGKPVRLVRYWGEGHVITGPANIRDLWARTIEWLEEPGRH